MTTTRTVITATPLYPGSFFPEEGRPVEIPDATPETALAAMDDDTFWFALDVRTTTQKRWTDGDGGEMWRTDSESARYRIYVGEVLTVADVEQLPGDHHVLLANMRGNDWGRVVRTRCGNFQPVEPGDVVIAAALAPTGHTEEGAQA
jgi:hypothetical protein